MKRFASIVAVAALIAITGLFALPKSRLASRGEPLGRESTENKSTESESEALAAPLTAIVVEGNRSITTDQILQLVQSQVGLPFDPKIVKEDVRTLVSKRWFFDVEIRVNQSKQGPVLVFRVRERPLVEKITYVGNRKIKDKELQKLARQYGLVVGGGYDMRQNRDAVQPILNAYREKGYRHAKVELEKGGSPREREVVFKIEEGVKVVVKKVGITGNASFTEDVLKSQLTTASSDLGEKYDPMSIPHDIHALRNYYINRGFFDIQITQHVSEEKAQVGIGYVIDEGIRYKIRNIEFVGNMVIPDDQLRENMSVKVDDYWAHRFIITDTEKMKAQYGELGRVFASVQSRWRSFEEPGYVDLIYEIKEDRPYSIGPVRRPANHADSDANSQIELASHEIMSAKATIDEPADLREIDRLTFTGAQAFDAADIRASLATDFETNLATLPRGSLFQYLKTLEHKIRSGYLHCGFPDASVEIQLNSTRRQIDVHVSEGTQVRCGGVRITGCKTLSAEVLMRSLTGDPQRHHQSVWKPEGPAPFDEDATARIRRRIESEFAEAGFFHPDFDVAINRQPEVATARLILVIKSEGRRAVVGNIEVTGTKRDSTDDVLKYLNLQPGTPFDAGVTDRLTRRLSGSARYLVHEVSEHPDGRTNADGHELHDLKIRLREYQQARPLRDELSPTDHALLKFRDWLMRWSQGEIDEDLVVTSSLDADDSILPQTESPEQQPAVLGSVAPQFGFRMVVGPNRGQIVTLKAKPMGGTPPIDLIFVADNDRLVFAAPQRHVKLELSDYFTENRLFFEFKGKSASEKSIDRTGSPFVMNLGWTFKRGKKPTASLFGISAEFTEAFMTSLAHFDDAECQLHDGTWHIANESFAIEIDAESGRLIEYRVQLDEGLPILVCRAQKQALQSELQQIDVTLAALATSYDASSPWKSVAEFLIDELLFAAGPDATTERAKAFRALRKVVGLWSPPGCGQLWNAGGEQRLPNDETFRLPSQPASRSSDDPFNSGEGWRKNLMSTFLPIYRRLVPKTGWMWPVGRDAALQWGSDAKSAGSSLRQAPMSFEIGPAGDLVVGLLGPYLGIDLTENAGRAGMQRLAAEAFANDYRPLLKGDSWMGQWLLSLAAALRDLDEAELKALVRLLPDDAPQEAIFNCLSLLTKEPGKPVAEVVPPVLDRLWSDVLRLKAETVFLEWVTIAIGKSYREGKVDPESTEYENEFNSSVEPAVATEDAAGIGSNERKNNDTKIEE